MYIVAHNLSREILREFALRMPTQYAAAMWRTALLLAVMGIALAVLPQNAKPESRATSSPQLPYLDWKACPFEGCQYGPWTARKPGIVFDTWKPERKEIARLAKGDKVTGETGVAITYEPGVVRMDRDLPEERLKRGDTILTYTYRGEGVSAVWFNGRFYREFDLSFTKWPDGRGCGGDHCAATYVKPGKKAWWAQIKLKSGATGWVNMEGAKFDGTDALE